MRLLRKISQLNKKIPKNIRFFLGLLILNIPPIIYLNIVKSKIASIYIAIIFLMMNMIALIAYFKIKEVEVESPMGKIKIKK